LTTVEQLRAARALLGWSQTELASRAGLSLPTVKRVEGGFGPNVSEEARSKLQRALEAAGLEFLEENGAGMGVRFANHGIQTEIDLVGLAFSSFLSLTPVIRTAWTLLHERSNLAALGPYREERSMQKVNRRSAVALGWQPLRRPW